MGNVAGEGEDYCTKVKKARENNKGRKGKKRDQRSDTNLLRTENCLHSAECLRRETEKIKERRPARKVPEGKLSARRPKRHEQP